MPQLRIGLAQGDFVVGDLSGNLDALVGWAHKAGTAGVHLLAAPEMAVTGYPPEDLVLRPAFVAAAERAVGELAARLAAEGLGHLAVVVGHVGRSSSGRSQNSASLLAEGRIVATYAKHHLPNYGVFDEHRYFEPGDRLPVVTVHGVAVAMTICEDLWQDGGPFAVCGQAGVGLVVCINGSPYERDKDDVRLALASRRAVEAGAPVAYVNMVGGQDELVFDGDSLVVDAAGALLARGRQMVEELLVVDLDLTAAAIPVEQQGAASSAAPLMTVERTDLWTAALTPYDIVVPQVAARLDDCAEVYAALVLATRDYVEKNGFPSVVLGLSGGIDSALVATIAVDALGGERVHTVAMPSAYSSDHSLTDAAELARRQGTQHRTLPVAPIVAAFQDSLHLTGLAEENLQARVRGTTLMALSNAEGHLVLTTGNKSELATGFSTLYGDSAGGFGPLKDLAKTDVWRLASWRNAAAVGRGEEPPIPEASISKPPSAELAPGQLDADRLPDYEVLDAIIDGYVGGDLGRDELVAAGLPAEVVDRVVRLVDAAEHKRRQSPPGPKLTPKAFGRDRRLPITNRWRDGGSMQS